MKLPGLVILSCLSGVAPLSSSLALAAGLCAESETTYLACMTSRHRWLSLCGVSGRSLQYRIGRPTAPEWQFPEDATAGPRLMLFSHYMRSETDRIEIRFENAHNDYVLYDYQEGKNRTAGIRVKTPGGKEQDLVCTGRIESRIGELQTTLQCDSESALNGGACK